MKSVKYEVLDEARALGVPEGAAIKIAEKVAQKVEEKNRGKVILTDNDIERAIAKEVKKYNADLAYVFENRGKII